MTKRSKNKNKLRHHKILESLAITLIVIIAAFAYWRYSIKAPILPSPSLKVLASNDGIALGAHAQLIRIGEKPYDSILTSQFSFLTIDGESDWNTTHPTEQTYNYTKVDKLVAFAKAHNMPIEYHHLVWGEADFLPNWLKNGNLTPDQLLNIIHQYITTTVGHFKGQIAAWTVVNEAFSREQHVNGLNDWWFDHIKDGTTYIDDSFIWAHQADPKAVLLLNDFENETENSISNAEYNYIKSAKARSIPIDGIGMQMHINAADPPSVSAMVANMKRFGAIGVPTYITEFDVNLNYVKGSSNYKNQLQAKITYDVVKACIESKTCVSFDEFGITDKENLLKSIFHTDSHSFLFNSRYQPQPSFYAFRSALLNAPLN